MLDQSEDGSASLKQIEVNTFSVAGFGATDRLPEVHRYEDHMARQISTDKDYIHTHQAMEHRWGGDRAADQNKIISLS